MTPIEERAHDEQPRPHDKWADAAMKRYGWYAHFVPLPDQWENNAHTHGFVESAGHCDIQIVVPMSPEHCHLIFTDLYARIKQGLQLHHGDEVPDLIKDRDNVSRPVRIVAAHEEGRAVYRLVFPDRAWRFPDDPQCDVDFARQVTINTDYRPAPLNIDPEHFDRMRARLRTALEIKPDSTIQQLAEIDRAVEEEPVLHLAVLEEMVESGEIVRGKKSLLFPRNYEYHLHGGV